MATTLVYPLVNNYYYDFTSVILNMAGLEFQGFKAITYNRTRTRTMVYGASPDPIGKTRGINAYSCEAEVYYGEWNIFLQQLGQGYGDLFFDILVTHQGGLATNSSAAFPTVQDQIISCTIDSSDQPNQQGTEPSTVKMIFNPLKIIYGNDLFDDLFVPLQGVNT